MTIGIVRTEWSGTTGGPGLTQHAVSYQAGASWTASAAQSAVDAVRKFWNSMVAYLPNELTLTVQPQLDQYDQASGLLSGTVAAATAPAPVVGTNTSGWAGGAGARIDWSTGSILNGRRVIGRTYIVPAAANIYDTSGGISATQRTNLTTFASTLLTDLSAAGAQLVVWHRPPVQETTGGLIFGVSSGACQYKTAVLRSRRD